MAKKTGGRKPRKRASAKAGKKPARRGPARKRPAKRRARRPRGITLHFEKISRHDRPAEPCTAAAPFARGSLGAGVPVAVFDGGAAVPTQSRATARWPDGSVKWLLVRTAR
jgi:hypothetical protein